MFTARADLSGLRRLEASVIADLTIGAQTAVQDVSEKATEAAQGSPTFKDKTCRLRQSILLDSLRVVFGHRVEAIVRASTPYAWFVHAGTKAHEIWPRAMYRSMGPLRKGQTRRGRHEGKGGPEFALGLGKFLRWEDPGGEEHFARMVHHPGTTARPFLAETIPIAAARLQGALIRMCESVARRWSN